MWNEYFLQITYLIGVIYLFGLAEYLLYRIFTALTGRAGYIFHRITGVIGTPVHELSHALMCILFGHRITKICLYSAKAENGTLGYVTHTYRKNNLYHRVGNFFISVAPVVFCPLVVVLFMRLLLPDAFNAAFYHISDVVDISELSILSPEFYKSFGRAVIGVIRAVFIDVDITSVKYLLFFILAIPISMHAKMSPQDFKSSLFGAFVLALSILAVDGIVFYLIKPEYVSIITGICAKAVITVASLILTGMVVYLSVIAVSAVIRLILKVIGRI